MRLHSIQYWVDQLHMVGVPHSLCYMKASELHSVVCVPRKVNLRFMAADHGVITSKMVWLNSAEQLNLKFVIILFWV